MNETNNINGWYEVINAFPNFTLTDFTFVHKLLFEYSESDHEYVISMIVSSSMTELSKSLRLRFSGVRKFSLKDFGSRPTQITGLDIVDISAKGWDGLNFECFDYEQSSIHFYSRTVEIRVGAGRADG